MDYTLIFLTSGFLILVVFLPLARLRLTTGVWGIVIRENSDEVENIVRIATSIMLLGLFGLALVVAKVGIEALSPFLAVEQTKPFGVILGILGMLVVIVAQAQMGASWRIGIDDEPTELCTKGLYGVVRHPIYTGIVICLLGVLLVAPTAWTLSIVLPGFLLISLQARLEEAHMRRQHGSEFTEWAQRTGRIIPGLGRLRANLDE